MALLRGNPSQIPKDAVILTEEQAWTYQKKIIEKWEAPMEVWALRYTHAILGALSGVTGIYINNHYRKKLRVGKYGHLASYLPIVVVPALFSMLSHQIFVQRSLIMSPLMQCPVCIEMRSVVFQGSLGVLYPTILAPCAAFMFATRHYTFRLPPITEKPMEVLKLWQKMTRPIVPILGAAFVAHGLASMYLTYKEMQQFIKLQIKLQDTGETLTDGAKDLSKL